MLDKFKKYGQSAKYFKIKRIGAFERSEDQGFAHVNTEAIDFDTTTEFFFEKQKYQTKPKSCDAVDIIGSKNRINLIEFKQLDRKETREDYINTLELPQKVRDSIFTLCGILRKLKNISKDEIETFYSCEKNAVISFKFPKDSAEQLALLFRTETIRQKTVTDLIQAEFEENKITDSIQAEFEENTIKAELKNVKCIRMEDFDDLYSKFNRAI